MGAVIVKLTQEPGDDRYVRWSENIDGPTHRFASSQEVYQYLMDDYSPNRIAEEGGPAEFGRATVVPILDRIRETGCSGLSHLSSAFRFDAGEGDIIPLPGPWYFHRSHLAEVVAVLKPYSGPLSEDDYQSQMSDLVNSGIVVKDEDLAKDSSSDVGSAP